VLKIVENLWAVVTNPAGELSAPQTPKLVGGGLLSPRTPPPLLAFGPLVLAPPPMKNPGHALVHQQAEISLGFPRSTITMESRDIDPDCCFILIDH